MAVEAALTHALNQWKRIAPKEFPNGAVVFCSEELAEILHPPTPLRRRIYDCGRHFNTSVIEDGINTQLGPAYGLIVVDGSDAAFGKVQGLGFCTASGPVISDLGRLGAHIAGRTRRGGQSALRYQRLRDESELAFLRKTAERAALLLTHVHGLILAGKADMKHRLRDELPEQLKKQVLCVVDLACDASPEALRQAALRASEVVVSSEISGGDRAVDYFFELVARETMHCYGEEQTIRALEMGAVEQLLLSMDLQTGLTVEDWKALAALHGTDVFEIAPKSERATQFCLAFGVGGCLRWALGEDLLEDPEGQPDTPWENEAAGEVSEDTLCVINADASKGQGSLEQVAANEKDELASNDHDSISTAETFCQCSAILDQRETLAWFETELKVMLGDASAAEALTTCVDVILSDVTTPMDEITESIIAVVCAEGVPEELALELVRRW